MSAFLNDTGSSTGIERILVPVDASDEALQALGAITCAANLFEVRIRLVHVRAWHSIQPATTREEVSLFPACTEIFSETAEGAAEVVDAAVADLLGRGIVADGEVVEAPWFRVGDAVAAAARTWGAELIVLHHRPRALASRWLRESVSEQVIREATCPLLVVRC